jgi:hypothetical protein
MDAPLGFFTFTDLYHFRVFSLPRNTVLVLGAEAGWPEHLEQDEAILAWAGHASDHVAALKAAF